MLLKRRRQLHILLEKWRVPFSMCVGMSQHAVSVEDDSANVFGSYIVVRPLTLTHLRKKPEAIHRCISPLPHRLLFARIMLLVLLLPLCTARM